MAVWQSIFQGIGRGIITAAEVQRGRTLVQQWGQFKVERAQQQIDFVASHAVAQRNGTLLSAIMNEFGEQIKNADTVADQQELCDLLWYFKMQVSEQIEMLPAGDSQN